MTGTELTDLYHGYITCLNSQNWPELSRFVDVEVHYNGQRVGLEGYRRMLEEDFRAIPDFRFNVELLVAEPPRVACRLRFDCTPAGMLFGFLSQWNKSRLQRERVLRISERQDSARLVSDR